MVIEGKKRNDHLQQLCDPVLDTFSNSVIPEMLGIRENCLYFYRGRNFEDIRSHCQVAQVVLKVCPRSPVLKSHSL
jgi:hypothetical protein